MSKQTEMLTDKLKELNINLEFIKKTMNRDECTQSERPRLDKALDNVTALSIEIRKKFETTKFSPSDQLKVKKLERDFESKMVIYHKMLEKYRDRKTQELRQLRHTAKIRRDTVEKYKRQDSEDEEDSRQGPTIELQQVNQQTMFYEHMIQLKQKQLLEVKEKMEEALKVQKEVGRIVNEQGEKLDLIEDNVDSARSNVKQAGQLLKEGIEHHKSANRKKMCIIGGIFILLLIIIVPVMIKLL